MTNAEGREVGETERKKGWQEINGSKERRRW
jgi:hypothetical protein